MVQLNFQILHKNYMFITLALGRLKNILDFHSLLCQTSQCKIFLTPKFITFY